MGISSGAKLAVALVMVLFLNYAQVRRAIPLLQAGDLDALEKLV